MTSALIGCTGFVGGNLASSRDFDLLIHRSNLESLRDAELSELVCAGLPAAKWTANQRPHDDAANIRRLQVVLSTVRAARVTVISTIDVYPCTEGADESYDCSLRPNHAYGAHRLGFEGFIRKIFPHAAVVRLPALFGPGLKKNVLYDLLYDNHLESINPASRFQWYPLERLPNDLLTVEAHGLQLVNLVTEPIETRKIVRDLFSEKTVGKSPDPVARYDLRSQHAALFDGSAGYLMRATPVMRCLRQFVEGHPTRQWTTRLQ